MTPITPIKDLRAYLEAPEVERIIAATTNPRDALLVRIPWRTGIRVSELIGIRIPDIDFTNKAIAIKILKTRKKDGKTIERRRLVPVDQGTLDLVKGYLVWRAKFPYKEDLLFPITRQRVLQIYWQLGRRVGIKELGIKITRKQAAEVIDLIHREQDATLGITWETIDSYLMLLINRGIIRRQTGESSEEKNPGLADAS